MTIDWSALLRECPGHSSGMVGRLSTMIKNPRNLRKVSKWPTCFPNKEGTVRGTEKPLSKEKKRRRGRGGTRKGRSRITTSIGVLGKPYPASCTVPAERKNGKESVRRARRKLSEAMFVDRKLTRLRAKVLSIQEGYWHPGKAKGIACLNGRIAQLERSSRTLTSVASSVRGLERRGAVIRRGNEAEKLILGTQIPPPASMTVPVISRQVLRGDRETIQPPGISLAERYGAGKGGGGPSRGALARFGAKRPCRDCGRDDASICYARGHLKGSKK